MRAERAAASVEAFVVAARLVLTLASVPVRVAALRVVLVNLLAARVVCSCECCARLKCSRLQCPIVLKLVFHPQTNIKIELNIMGLHHTLQREWRHQELLLVLWPVAYLMWMPDSCEVAVFDW